MKRKITSYDRMGIEQYSSEFIKRTLSSLSFNESICVDYPRIIRMFNYKIFTGAEDLSEILELMYIIFEKEDVDSLIESSKINKYLKELLL